MFKIGLISGCDALLASPIETLVYFILIRLVAARYCRHTALHTDSFRLAELKTIIGMLVCACIQTFRLRRSVHVFSSSTTFQGLLPIQCFVLHYIVLHRPTVYK